MKTTSLARVEATAAPDHGYSKEQAARFLGVSARQVQRLAAAGQIHKRTLPKAPGEKTPAVVYSRRDLEALKRGEIQAKPATVVGGSKAHESIVTAGAAEFLNHVAAALALPAVSGPNPWLTIPEAAKASKLPAWFLRERAPQMAKRGEAVNVGRGEKPRWRILESSLKRPLLAN
jgi:hypothetical protein